jgi:phage tail sheath protein FI
MTLRPGVQVQVLTTPPPRSAPTDTGIWFVVGTSDQGRVDKPMFLSSMSDFTRLLGARQSYSLLYDALEEFFREGGSRAYVSRVVGPAAVQASKNLLDAVAAISLIVRALGPGTYGNSIKVGVVAGVTGGSFQIQITDANNVVLEQSGDLLTQQDAATWSVTSQYVTITVGASALNPAVAAPVVMAGGTDDRLNITDAQWQAALDRFTRDLGPGNVSAPGRTTTTGYTQLADHAKNNNRVAFLDAADTPTVATIQTAVANAKSTGSGQYAALFAPWIVIPGIVPGTTRTVPPSATAAGRASATDAAEGPGVPAAGEGKGTSRFALDVSQPSWTDSQRDTLNTSGVNVIRNLEGDVVIYGWRSLADPINNPYWVPLGTVRYLMGLGARAWARGQSYIFDQIDGQGHTIAAYHGALVSLCQDDWVLGEIYGVTASEAFNVDTGPGVNTDAALAGNELRAVIAVRPSPFAELVTIQIVNVPITQEVS